MGLSVDNYYDKESNIEYMSVSQYKAFKKCEASAGAELLGVYERPLSKVFEEGILGEFALLNDRQEVDSFIEEEGSRFLKSNKTLYSNFSRVVDNAERVKADSFFMDFLKGERSVILEGDISGVKLKGMLDVLNRDSIVDIKFMANFDNRLGENFISFYDYDIQLAVYQELVRQATGKKLPCYIAGVTKEEVCDYGIFLVPDNILAMKLQEFIETLPSIQFSKELALSGYGELERCEKCDYCKSTKRLNSVIDIFSEVDIQ